MSSTKLDPDNPKKEYTGVWIPKVVMECHDLSPIDKIVYGEIACFEECYGSNKWLAERIQRSEWTARQSISKLEQLGFIRRIERDGKIRTLKVLKNPHPVGKSTRGVLKNQQGGCRKINTIDKRIDNKKDIMDTKVSIGETPVYGKAEINQLFTFWESATGIPITSNITKNRYACHNLIGKYDVGGVEKLIRVVEKAQADKYAPRVADFCDLQAKLNQLLVWAKGQVSNNQVISVEDF